MNITEFFLVLTFATSNGASMTTIPGYYSDHECRTAGKIYVADVDTRWTDARFSCLPRPTGSKER